MIRRRRLIDDTPEHRAQALAELRALGKSLGYPPTMGEMNIRYNRGLGRFSALHFVRWFGTWRGAQRAAGLPESPKRGAPRPRVE